MLSIKAGQSYVRLHSPVQPNIIIHVTRSLGFNNSKRVISELCNTELNKSYEIKNYHSGHICMFLRHITVILNNYL